MTGRQALCLICTLKAELEKCRAALKDCQENPPVANALTADMTTITADDTTHTADQTHE